MTKWNQPSPDALTGYAAILGTVLLTVFGQIVLKWQIAKAGVLPAGFAPKILFLVGQIWNPWILSGVGAGFLAFLCWMAALTKFELSYAYPFMSSSFLLVLILSSVFFHEALTIPKVVGVALVMVGIVVGSRG
ncbi:MAG: EamA family transporter [Chthoniobacterales bacterium]|nr:EamA family transporter [Chthoniobacterales bacterium]